MKRSITIMKVGVFFGLLAETYLNAALPSLMEFFSVSATSVQWLTSLYILTMGLCVPISAFLIKRTTAKELFIGTIGLFLFGTLMGASAPNFPLLLIARIIQAAGASMTLPLMIHSIMATYEVHERGKAMGSAMLVVLIAPAIGPTVGALIMQLLSWRWIFLATALGGLFVLVWALKTMDTHGQKQQASADGFSIALSVTGFGAFVYGVQQLLAGSNEPIRSSIIIAAGIAAIIGFVLRQRTLAQPMLDLSILSERVYAIGTLLIVVTHLAVFGSFILLPMYLVNVCGLLPFWAGIAMLPGGFIGALAPSVAGHLYDRFGPRSVVLSGFLLLALANLLFGVLAGCTNALVFVTIYIILMCGFGITLTPLQTHSLNQLGRSQLGHGTAILNTSMLIASSMGGSVFVAIMSYRSASLEGTPAPFVGGFSYAYRITALVALAGVLLSLPFGRESKSK
jgi:DHA2 family lincomycin resistance protein-like MFS transporter